MKKPEIKVNEFIIGDDEVRIEGGSISINDKELFEDELAELIKEMIDALIDIVDNHTVQTTSDKRRWDKAKQALKKAGCENDS
ncbi:hypothetical protein [Schnuerera sp.]|uniref:hypothetical protein n=1 Tax=Schnuerera sp. TaxID=2794844 RepID=UPI002CCE1460|nr:hypothetical protein [Schnuerera sp.]HSH35630.1 hypothetical protein [Schnuerera sp.]